MNDGESPFLKVLSELSKVETIWEIPEVQKKRYLKKKGGSVFGVETEILIKGRIIPVKLIVVLLQDFPYSLPRLFLDPDCSKRIGPIPHIDEKHFICTFDDEVVTLDPLNPYGIILESLRRAKTLIHTGIYGENQEDFIAEFLAYWERKYNKEHLPESILSLVDTYREDLNLRLICFEKRLTIYSYALYYDNQESKIFKEFLADFQIKYREVNVFYAADLQIPDKPPYNLTNRRSIELFESKVNLTEFKRYINGPDNPKLVVTLKKLPIKSVIIGWFYNPLNTNINGFRPGMFKPFDALKRTQGGEHVHRIAIDQFTPDRLNLRSAGGSILDIHYTFCVAGLGSIGSNLFYFLNSFNNCTFRFLDPDNLLLENITRHFLGFNYIGQNKADAMRDFGMSSNPLQTILSKANSIHEVIDEDPSFINDSDFLISAIGNQNTESWIGNAIKERIISVPTLFIWVEPYLSGGHFIYIHPTQPYYSKYFENGLFKFNIIDNPEYERNPPGLLLQESGCQTTYTPYSSLNIQSFLSAIFPKIQAVIEDKTEVTKSFSWKGESGILTDLEISLSSRGKNARVGEIIENHI